MIAVSEFLHYSSPASTHNARDQLPTSANCDTCDKTDERALPMRELETSPFEKDRTCISGCRAAHSLHSFFRASLHSYLGLGGRRHQGSRRRPPFPLFPRHLGIFSTQFCPEPLFIRILISDPNRFVSCPNSGYPYASF